jgi:signal transduction histidine kinase
MEERVASLEARLASTEDVQTRIDLLNDLAGELVRYDPRRAGAYSKEARRLATSGPYARKPYLLGLAASILNLCAGEFYLSRYEAALRLADEGLDLARQAGNQSIQARLNRFTGNCYFCQGNYPEALSFWLAALKEAREADDLSNQSALLNNIGVLYNHLHNAEEGLANLRRALEIDLQLGDKYALAYTLHNMGNSYALLGDYEKALDYDLQGLAGYRGTGNKRGETEVLHNLGEVYLALGQKDRAMQSFEDGLALAREIDHWQEVAGLLSDMGACYGEQGQAERAFEYFRQALEVATGIEARQQIYQAHEKLAGLYEAEGDFRSALDHYRQFHTVKEQVFNELADLRLKSLQVVHQVETTRHESEINYLRSVELQRQIDEKEALIADLDAFAHTVAHDLQNPLSLIIGYASFLQTIAEETLNGEIREAVEPILQTSEKMVHIVDELLILSSVRQQEVRPISLDMAEIVSEVQKRLRQVIEEYGATLVLPESWPAAAGHPAWVEEIWVNYISNAIKYGGSPPRVELGAEPGADGMVRFWVRDNGDGLDPAVRDRLFAAYTRLDQVRASGYGLGLSIVRRIVDKLGGEVDIESPNRPGQGSTFTFTLPANPPGQ